MIDQGLATQSPDNLAKAIGLFFILVLGLAFGSFARFDQWQEQFTHVDNARNPGPMAAFELVERKDTHKPMPELAGAITKKAKEKGLILLSCGMHGNTLRFLMPVTIEDEVLEEGLNIVEGWLSKTVRSHGWRSPSATRMCRRSVFWRAIPHNGPCTVSEGLPPPTLFTSFNVTKKHTLLSSTPLFSALRMCWLIINHCML